MYLTCIPLSHNLQSSLLRFNIGLTNIDARLKQRCINVIPTLCNVVLTLCNVLSTLLQRRALTFYQRCATLKIWRRILLHFQRRINVISTSIHNVERTFIRRWNVGWDSSHSYLRLDTKQLTIFHIVFFRKTNVTDTNCILPQFEWAH